MKDKERSYYHVVYMGEGQIGSCFIDTETPIDYSSAERVIRNWESILKEKNNIASLTITNWTLLDK